MNSDQKEVPQAKVVTPPKSEVINQAELPPTYNGLTREDITETTLPGLSHFQMFAEPRVIEEGDNAGEELVSIKTFKDLFMCPICFNLLKNPEAVRYCMHKFCRDCVTELSKSSRQCPQCRVQLGSRRIWRADTLTQ